MYEYGYSSTVFRTSYGTSSTVSTNKSSQFLPSLRHNVSRRRVMWWSASKPPEDDKERKPHSSWVSPVIPNDWSYYTSPDVVIPTALLTGAILITTRLYRSYLRRIPGASKISTSFWRRRSLFGKVTSVGDGDGFRLFHTPGGRLAGWGWLPWRKIPSGKALKDNTVRA